MGGCCPQPTVPPNQTMARLAFPRHGCVNTVQRETEKKDNGQKGAEGRVGGEVGDGLEGTWVSQLLQDEKLSLPFNPVKNENTGHASRRETVGEHYQSEGTKAGTTTRFLSQDKNVAHCSFKGYFLPL